MKLLAVCFCLLATSAFGGVVKRTADSDSLLDSATDIVGKLLSSIAGSQNLTTAVLPDLGLHVGLSVAGIGVSADVEGPTVTGLNNASTIGSIGITSDDDTLLGLSVVLGLNLQIKADTDVVVLVIKSTGDVDVEVNNITVNLDVKVLTGDVTGLSLEACVLNEATEIVANINVSPDLTAGVLSSLTGSVIDWVNNTILPAVAKLLEVNLDVLVSGLSL